MRYDYHCKGCDEIWEHSQALSEENLTECPFCSYNIVERLMSSFYISTGTHTMGSLAEKNAKALGGAREDALQSMANDRRGQVSTFKGKIPEGGSPVDTSKLVKPDPSLAKLNPEQRTKYIMEGKLPPKSWLK
jgi:putative FmdB family regulatory protein